MTKSPPRLLIMTETERFFFKNFDTVFYIKDIKRDFSFIYRSLSEFFLTFYLHDKGKVTKISQDDLKNSPRCTYFTEGSME